jgi:hypothetical protein
MDASPIQVEPEGFGSTIAESEGGGGFGWVGEPVQLGEPDRAVAGFDVAEHSAGADRGELLIITDQPDTATTTNDELDGGVQGERVRHSGFVDDHQAGPADALHPIWQVAVVDGPGELGQRLGWCTGGVAKLRRRGGRRREPEHLAAAVAPRPSQGTHRGGFPGAGRGNRQLQPRPGGAHVPNQSRLPGI